MSTAILAQTSSEGSHGCSTCNPTPRMESFQSLVQEIRQYLGPSWGIDSADVDPKHLESLMAKYTSNEEEWSRYARADLSRNYTRNIVDNVNGRANLVLIVWNPGKGSPVHDHADAHCVMKMLRGSLKETMFHIPNAQEEVGTPLKTKKETIYAPDQVAYISDKIGLHRISNPDGENAAVSLHLYTPPNAAEFGFNIYDEKTGRSSHVKQS